MKKSILILSCLALLVIAPAFTPTAVNDENPNYVGCYEFSVKCGSKIWKEVQKGSSSSDAKKKLQAKYPQCRLNLSRTVKCD